MLYATLDSFFAEGFANVSLSATLFEFMLCYICMKSQRVNIYFNILVPLIHLVSTIWLVVSLKFPYLLCVNINNCCTSCPNNESIGICLEILFITYLIAKKNGFYLYIQYSQTQNWMQQTTLVWLHWTVHSRKKCHYIGKTEGRVSSRCFSQFTVSRRWPFKPILPSTLAV